MNQVLWQPTTERITQSNMVRFMAAVNQKYPLAIKNYNELYGWSIDKPADFWAEVWEFNQIRAAQTYQQVMTRAGHMLDTSWFIGAQLNFAENLLRFRDQRTALIFKGEALDKPVYTTYQQLYLQVAKVAAALRQRGVTAGDRVAGFMPNMTETVVAMLATASIGAIWTSCSPDFGSKGVLDRFGQTKPKILFTANGYSYNGQTFSCLEKVAEIVLHLPSIEGIVVCDYIATPTNIDNLPQALRYADLLNTEATEITFAQLPFNHPLYIMYSSGTTGVPKCIVHSAGGTLLQHLKELVLHTDLKREDTIFYFTTCGWMMWNWLVSALAVGATVVLFDGAPFYPDSGALWQLAQDEKITIFGTSAKYIEAVEKSGLKPGSSYDLSSVKAILSTGSPLSGKSFEFIYSQVKADVCLSSISGGTDIISCFALGNPILPVRKGELQCRGLGMKVESWDAAGQSLTNAKGDLVCTTPFPSMPIGFWQDPAKEKYRQAYFDTYPNVWHHGDYIEITDTGGVIVYGRSDATLNPGGVRIGTAEIYRQVETIPEVQDSLVVGQNWENDVRIILFVKLAEGRSLTVELNQRIKHIIRTNATPRHVPAKILTVQEIPYTLNGKKVELAVRNIIHNLPVLNQDALANPAALKLYMHLPELQLS